MMTTTEILTGIKNWVTGKLTLKQDVINDLASIRSGAQAGATSVQPADILSYFDDAAYDSGTHRINFYHGQSAIAYIDASPFIIDGMVDDVRIENGYLVIDFNTASGKQDISIPLTDIFNPNNYYTKSETDSQLTQKQTEIDDLYARIGYYVCSTEGNVAAKTIVANNYTLGNGGSIKIKMTNANTVNNATLNINSTGAKALYYDGERASAKNSWEAGETVEVYYDGTSFYANNVAGGSGSGDGAFDVSAKYPTSGVDGGNTYTLEGALAVLNANLSASKKKGGMSIKFIHSSDNNYVRYDYMGTSTAAADFTNVSNWQGVDSEPVMESQNLVKSGGVALLRAEIIKAAENNSIPFSASIDNYTIEADGSGSYNSTTKLFYISPVPSYVKTVKVCTNVGSESFAIAFFSKDSHSSTYLLSGSVVGHGADIYEAEVPEGTRRLCVVCKKDHLDKFAFSYGNSGSYPKEITVIKDDIKSELGDSTESVLSQNASKELSGRLRKASKVNIYNGSDNIYESGKYLYGEVGETISIGSNIQKKYTILPINGFSIVKYGKYFSSLNLATYWLDDNDVILSKAPIVNSGENSSVYMDCSVQNATKVGITVDNGDLNCSLISVNRYPVTCNWKQGAIGTNGIVDTSSTVQKYTKVFVKGSSYIMADVRKYGGGTAYLMAFYKSDNTFILSKYPIITTYSASTSSVFVAAEVPQEAEYAYVMTRAEYVNSAKVFVDNWCTIEQYYIDSLQEGVAELQEVSKKFNNVYDSGTTGVNYVPLYMTGEAGGDIGDTISFDATSTSSRYTIIEKDVFTCIWWNSVTSGTIFFVDDDNKILDKRNNRAGYRMDVFGDASKLVICFNQSYTSTVSYTLFDYQFHEIQGCLGFNRLVKENGVIVDRTDDTIPRQYGKFLTYKVNVTNQKAIFAKVRCLSNPTDAAWVFSFYDSNDSYISQYVNMIGLNGATDTIEFTGAIVPATAAYCLICSQRWYNVKIYGTDDYCEQELSSNKGYVTSSPLYTYEGAAISLHRNTFSIGRQGVNVLPDYIKEDNNYRASQGMAIWGDVMFRFFHTGICETYNILDGLNFEKISRFNIGSAGENNHVNSCQFSNIMSDTGFPYLYIAACNEAKVYVEKVSKIGSTLQQTINIPYASSCAVDADYLYLIKKKDDYTIIVSKFNLPSLENATVTLTTEDAIETIEYPHNFTTQGQLQGTKVYNNLLYAVFGEDITYGYRTISIFDLISKQLVSFVDLSAVVDQELEDIEIYNNLAIININHIGAGDHEGDNKRGDGVYVLKFN